MLITSTIATYYYKPVGGSTSLLQFNVSLVDGAVHDVILAINGTTATLTVDGTAQPPQALAGAPDDCSTSDPSCVLWLGQRAAIVNGSASYGFRLTGSIYRAHLNPTTITPPLPPLPSAALTMDVFAEIEAEGMEALPLIDGLVAFNGSTGLAVLRFVPVQPTFALHFEIRAANGSMGYLLAKCDASGSRYFSLYGSAGGATYLYYRTPGSAAVHNVMWAAVLNDGAPHNVTLAVDHASATLTVDGVVRGVAALVGPVDDCASAGPNCQLLVGKRAAVMVPGAFFFEGYMAAASITFNQAT